MTLQRRLLFLLSLAAIPWAVPPLAHACPPMQEAEAARRAGDVEALKRGHMAAMATVRCTPEDIVEISRMVAVSSLEVSRSLPPAQAVTMLEEGARRNRQVWQLYGRLGELYSDMNRNAEAARAFETALTIIGDEDSTPAAPADSVINDLIERAKESRQLAEGYLTPVKDRAGEPGGLWADNVRGVVVGDVAVPIRFEYDSAQMTPDGLRAAQDMAEILKAQGKTAVVLSGHTDSDGEDAYNCKLSRDRLEEARKRLKEYGFTGEVRIVAKGERQPAVIRNSQRYTPDQIKAQNRRVEYLRNTGNEAKVMANACS
ncbi:OmpA family protein [Niveispirillum sp.]|uniref:OmpA family protein n=1 Tax=Niveispirillum sp. TaxID=1917217 RepID=UPI001B69173D|nr:OmpA family protein [Niveispirillum sp.]MBP7335880.1 OmpA family protein [Niveispirillum sp.]